MIKSAIKKLEVLGYTDLHQSGGVISGNFSKNDREYHFALKLESLDGLDSIVSTVERMKESTND